MKHLLLILSLLTSLAQADTWILRDATTKATIVTSRRADGFIPEAIDRANAEIVRVVEEAQPAFNPATHKLVQSILEAGTNPIVQTRSWVITPLTAEELAELADAAAREAKRVAVKNAIPTLRNWVTQLEAVTVTSGNAVNMLQALIDRQEIFYARFADLLEAQRIDR